MTIKQIPARLFPGLRDLLSRRPCLSFALTGLPLLLLAWALGARHDSPGVLGALYYTAALFCLPFWGVQLLLDPLFPGPVGSGTAVASVIIGLALCLLFDRWLGRRRGKTSAGGAEGEGRDR